MADYIATHELNGVKLAQREDASGRTFFWDIEGKKRAKLDGQEPVPLASVGTVPPDAPEGGTSTPPHSQAGAISVPTIALAVALQATHGPTEYAEAPGGYAARGLSEREAELFLPSPEGGHEVYLLRLPETFALHLERIR